MSVPVRALVVDDSASSASLLFEELRRGGFEPSFERVTTREQLEGALARSSWDVVLSELSAERLGAFEALALLKERDVDIPFLIVSESLEEETAIRAMKAGAQNCIPRASLMRLCPILERELREAQIRRERRIVQQRALGERAALPKPGGVRSRRDPDRRRRRHAALRQSVRRERSSECPSPR